MTRLHWQPFHNESAERVTVQDLGSLGEFIASIATLVTLVYLAVQIRQSNRLAKRAAVQSVLAGRAEVNRFIASDPVLTELFWRGMQSPDELDEIELLRFTTAFSAMSRHYEAIFLDNQEGLLTPGIWRSQESSMKRVLSMPGAQNILSELESDFDEAFVQHVKRLTGA